MIVNILILCAILLYCAYVIRRQIKNRKNPGAGCCGCSGCAGLGGCADCGKSPDAIKGGK